MSVKLGTDTSDTWLSYKEAAARLGISENAVRLRVSRGKLLATRGNDGHPRVSISMSSGMSAQHPDTLDTVARHDMTQTHLTHAQPPAGAGDVVPLSVLQQTVDAVQRAANTALAAVQEQHQAEVARLREDASQLRTDHATEVAQAREDADRRLDQQRADYNHRLDQQRAAFRWERVWFCVAMATMALMVLAPILARH